MPIRTRFAEVMEEEGRKYVWLSEQTGIKRQALSNYANGLHVPRAKRQLIADTLGRDVEDVFPEPQRIAA